MRLTLHTDYALRVLIYLGTKNGMPTTIEEISEAYHISKNHLLKVVHRLSKNGFIRSQRGRGGGLFLAYSARDIGIGEVIRRSEESLALAECMGPNAGRCVLNPGCALKNILGEAKLAFFQTLDRYTLADLLTPHASKSLGLMQDLTVLERPFNLAASRNDVMQSKIGRKGSAHTQ